MLSIGASKKAGITVRGSSGGEDAIRRAKERLDMWQASLLPQLPPGALFGAEHEVIAGQGGEVSVVRRLTVTSA